jgi:hypothetical protein
MPWLLRRTCQLKLDSYQGLARGATKEQIYSTTRLSPAPLSRLFEDAQTTAGWRVLGFSPVLPDQADASGGQRSCVGGLCQLGADQSRRSRLQPLREQMTH